MMMLLLKTRRKENRMARMGNSQWFKMDDPSRFTSPSVGSLKEGVAVLEVHSAHSDHSLVDQALEKHNKANWRKRIGLKSCSVIS